MILRNHEHERPVSELAKTCFWILSMTSYSKGRRVELALEKIKGIVDEHPDGTKYKKDIEEGFFSKITKADKGRGELIKRTSQIHRFCFNVIETEVRGLVS